MREKEVDDEEMKEGNKDQKKKIRNKKVEEGETELERSFFSLILFSIPWLSSQHLCLKMALI